jgi:Holliday junction DNA helicase RuvA
MIASIRGTLEAKAPDRLVVQVGGVGVRVLVPTGVVSDAGDVGDPVHLLTHLQVREDSLTLFGFADAEQLRLFELLTSVTGVGPAVALGILSTGDTAAVEGAIAGENVEFLSRAPRLGKKLAARIALELKGKVRPALGERAPGEAAVGAPDGDFVLGALLSFGYTAGEAQAALRNVPADPELSTEDRLRLALAHFNRA